MTGNSYNDDMKQGLKCYIRWMIRRDMPEVLDIEDNSFEYPWSEEDFVNCLRQRNCIPMISESNKNIINGYMIYELHKKRLHILNFAVDQEYRRRGIGTQMITKLQGKLSHQKRTRLLIEVRERNLPMLKFLKSQGFRATNVLRDFYEDTTEDAYLMEYKHRSLEYNITEYLPTNRISKLTG